MIILKKLAFLLYTTKYSVQRLTFRTEHAFVIYWTQSGYRSLLKEIYDSTKGDFLGQLSIESHT